MGLFPVPLNQQLGTKSENKETLSVSIMDIIPSNWKQTFSRGCHRPCCTYQHCAQDGKKRTMMPFWSVGATIRMLCSLRWVMFFFGDKKSAFKEDAIEEKINGGD